MSAQGPEWASTVPGVPGMSSGVVTYRTVCARVQRVGFQWRWAWKGTLTVWRNTINKLGPS